MKNDIISAPLEFHEKLLPFYGRHFAFRGVKKETDQLVPKVGRFKGFESHEALVNAEKMMLDEFKRVALPYIDRIPADDWEWLALAQHHGMATRFLDWSHNPLVAAFFAVEDEEYMCDSFLYVLDLRELSSFDLRKSPHAITEAAVYNPAHVSRRIAAQEGIFTAFSLPRTPLEKGVLVKFAIKGFFRQRLKQHLFHYGIHSRGIFPDLDSVAKIVEWQHKSNGYSSSPECPVA